jgi:tRNA dimethylallyltransferase
LTRHLALVGCTASGKSALALAVARAAGDAEIVSLDSMQVYRGMDVGTAKPTAAELASVPYHLVDVVDPDADWSVRATQDAAAAAIAGIEARGKRALLVGGTGLYVRAVVDGLVVPARDIAVRARLETETSDGRGLAAAYARLAAADPVAAARIEPANRRRIVRALEVIETSGRPFSSFGPGLAAYGPPAVDTALVGVWLPRAELGHRITARFRTMREQGLVDEVRGLAARPAGLSRTAGQALGYKEVLAYLAGDIATLDEALDLAVRRTRQFARRQRMWFRRDPRVRWMGAARNPDRLAPVVLAIWRAGRPATTADRT